MNVPINGEPCSSPALGAGSSSRSAQPAQGASLSPAKSLSTLQRNALCKLLDRPQFTPEDVVRLGYRRLAQAEGIGRKSLTAILAWLQANGYELQPDPSTVVATPHAPRGGGGRGLASALKLVRNYGYVVLPPRPESSTEASALAGESLLRKPISK
jgi:hypothetical protein